MDVGPGGAAQSPLAQEVTFCMLPLGGSSAGGGEGADDQPVSRAVWSALQKALYVSASDLHVGPSKQREAVPPGGHPPPKV